MAEKIDYLSEVRRMGGLEFTPQTPEAWAELAKILQRHAKSRDHASRIVGRFLEPGAGTRFPTPGEFASAARSIPADASFDRPDLPNACEACEPYAGLYRIVARNGAEGAARCDCARGTRLRQLDAIRQTTGQGKPADRARHEHPADADWQRKAAGDL